MRIQSEKSHQRKILNYLLEQNKPIYYSKSYSKDFAVVMTSNKYPVAIDIEKRRPLSQNQQKILSRFMNEEDSIICNERKSDFILTLWSLKEVYSKYFCKGLYMDFSKIIVQNHKNYGYLVSLNGKEKKHVNLIKTASYFVTYII